MAAAGEAELPLLRCMFRFVWFKKKPSPKPSRRLPSAERVRAKLCRLSPMNLQSVTVYPSTRPVTASSGSDLPRLVCQVPLNVGPDWRSTIQPWKRSSAQVKPQVPDRSVADWAKPTPADRNIAAAIQDLSITQSVAQAAVLQSGVTPGKARHPT